MTRQFYCMDPHKAYITNNLVLPKGGVNLAAVMTALTFQHGEEEIYDELDQLIGVRAGELRLWEENRHHIIVPREFLPPNQRSAFGFEFIDLSPKAFHEVNIRDNIVLRDEAQEESFAALIGNHSGTLNLACGQGKTVLAMKMAATLKVPTIIIVNTTALLEQWKEEISKFLDVESVGTIQGDAANWQHPLVLAMVHTLSQRRNKWSMKFRRHFGLVFYDEGHHMSAPVFVRSADLFFGRRFSLTATASRIDGLESIYQSHLGGVIHRNLEQQLIPATVFHRMKWEFDLRYKPLISDANNDISLPRVRTFLGGLDWRNNFIYQTLSSDLQAGRTVLVLSHSVEHVRRLDEIVTLRARGAKPGVITGDTPQGDRMRILRESNPVIGTFQLAREGLNKPELDTLYCTTPFSSPNDRQQAWGRIQRRYEGKLPPLVRVFEDCALKICEGCGRSLRRNLKNLGYPIKMKDEKVETT